MPFIFGCPGRRSRRGETWKCLPSSIEVDWPSTPSPWECRCGAVWALEGTDELEKPSETQTLAALLVEQGFFAAEAPHPPGIDATVVLPQLADLSDHELEALAQLVGREQSRRTSPAVETAHPPPQAERKAEQSELGSSDDAEKSKEKATVSPAREAAHKPAMAYIAQWGKVWHADTNCKHLFLRGERRPHIREVPLAEVRRMTAFPPCKDCSAAWAGALQSPRLRLRGAQQ